MEFQNDKDHGGRVVATEPAEHSVGGELSDEEARIWKLEGYGELPRGMSVPDVGRHMGVSQSTAYNMCKDGTIRARRCGGRLFITRLELFRLMHGPTTPPTAA